MRIILDSDVIIAERSVSSRRFEVLAQHIDKTGASVAMPRIVLQEVSSRRKEHLTAAVDKSLKAHKDIRSYLGERAPLISEVDIEAETQYFLNELARKLRYKEQEIIPYDGKYLEDVALRAINRTPPCSSHGEQIRDAIIWLTVLDIGSSEADKTVIFISEDRTFRDSNDSLKPELAEEATVRGVKLMFFSSLHEFAENHADSISFITKEWILGRVPVKEVLIAGNEIINEGFQSSISWELSSVERGDDMMPTGYLAEISSTVDIVRFFVNVLPNGDLRIEATYDAELEFECEFEYREEPKSERGRWQFNPLTEDMEYETGAVSESNIVTKMLYVYPCVEIGIEILVRNQEVIEWNLL